MTVLAWVIIVMAVLLLALIAITGLCACILSSRCSRFEEQRRRGR